MSRTEWIDALLDFVYDRGRFAAAAELEGMAASQKPDLFVEFYVALSPEDRSGMNECLVSALLGRNHETERYAGIVAMLLTALVHRLSGTGLEEFQTDLLQELTHSANRESWLEDSDDCSDFRLNWRYPLAIINVLSGLNVSGLRDIVREMLASAKSSMFTRRLREILETLTTGAKRL